MGELIGLIIVGAIIGALARLFMKGDQKLGIIWTIVLGALGALIGSWIAGLIGVEDTAGIDWIRWVISIASAVALISLYLGVTRGNRRA